MMRDELTAKLADHEDNFVERKPESANKSEIRRTVVAFANSVPVGRQAVLFIGVSDDGRVQGCQNTDHKQKDVRAACAECYPPIVPICEVLRVGDLSVVAVLIGASDNRPHFAGPAYVRVGSESVAASPQLFDELIHSRNSKTAAILGMKDSPVTVVSIGHKLGTAARRSPNAYSEHHECIVVDCDAHTVRLRILASQRLVAVPLDQIAISRDEEKQRPKLVTSGY